VKKPKTVADLLAIADTCIEASEARAQLLESRGKGPTKKKQDDQEVNKTDREDRKDRRDPDDAEKCEIHRTLGHDLEECRIFLDRNKMPAPVAQVA
jgi:hypothetical protein